MQRRDPVLRDIGFLVWYSDDEPSAKLRKPSAMADFKNLRVWDAAQKLAVDTHHVASRLRGPGSSSLRDQLLRSSMSIPTNIVEGSAHSSPREFVRFLGYALASTSEVEGHTRLAETLHLISRQDSDHLLDGVEIVRKMLHGLIEHVKARPQ